MTDLSHSIRRTPVQERSSDTVQQILRAASQLLERESMEQITTSRIAAEAGVSIGALYRFFPDKQAVIDAIAVKHVEELRRMLEQTFSGALPEDGAAFLGAIVDAYVGFLDSRPDFRRIALGRHVSASTHQKQAGPDVGPAALVKQFILDQLGMDVGDLDLKIRIASEAGERLIAYAYEQPAGPARDSVVAEMKALLSKYLFD